MNVFEKMLFVKSLPIFKHVKDDVLLSFVPYLKEQRAKAKEVVINKGDIGNLMYLIVEGEVSVRDGDNLLATLQGREVFGELAALSPQVRIASIIANKETFLLHVSEPVLTEFIELEPSFAKGIIESLCDRIRAISGKGAIKSPL